MNTHNRSRSSRAFRPSCSDVLEVRSLLAVDPTLVILPDVVGEFDPNNITNVDLPTLQSRAGTLTMAFAPPSHIEGGEAASQSALIALIDDRKDALIDEVDLAIVDLELVAVRLALVSAHVGTLITETNNALPAVTDPDVRQAMIDQRDTWMAGKAILDGWIFDCAQEVFLLEVLKTEIENTFNIMVANIIQTNIANDPNDPPIYVYSVETTTIA